VPMNNSYQFISISRFPYQYLVGLEYVPMNNSYQFISISRFPY
jgi:hypothetical protein